MVVITPIQFGLLGLAALFGAACSGDTQSNSDQDECPRSASECPAGCELSVLGYRVDTADMCVDTREQLVVGCAHDLGACKSAYFCFERLEDGALFYADGCLDEPEFAESWALCSGDEEEALEGGNRECVNIP